ncbi:protein Flattop [Takifugu rubripes]|uniref:protein Flattop n=1 Tax=Takifugu rubripes TaxID=31033 RepID=UPI0011459DE6|nr:protein Flattop [Takifugu rubripes]
MSSNYSANQFEGAFKPRRMRVWSSSNYVSKRPAARSGHTTFISDDRGHLLPGAEKKNSAWPDFKGTWALPSRIPACHINPTSRSVDGLQQLRSLGLYPQLTGNNHPLQPDGRCSDEEQDNSQYEDEDINVTYIESSEDGDAAPSTRAEAQKAPLRRQQSCSLLIIEMNSRQRLR